MRILSLGLDKSVLDLNSKTAKRVGEYKSLVEKYIVLVPEKQSKIVALFDLYKRAKNIIKKENISLITVQDQYFIGLLGYVLAKKYEIRLEVQIHGFEKFFGIRKWIARFVITRANSVRVVSQRLKNQLTKEFGVNEEKINVVPIFVDTKSALSLRGVERRGNLYPFIFLTVGRLVPVKNIALQIEALREVLNKYPQAELWIVGDGPELNNLKSLCQKFQLNAGPPLAENVDGNISFLGYQENVDSFYDQADVFLLTSNSEGWGMAVVEAASHGLPIIMTDVGLAGEVIINNESGLVIPVGDKQGLVQAMLRLIKDNELRSKLARGATEAIKKLPTKEEILRLYKESWQKALK